MNTKKEKDLCLRTALEQDRLEEFVRQAQAEGLTLRRGSEYERGLALLMIQQHREREAHSNSGR